MPTQGEAGRGHHGLAQRVLVDDVGQDRADQDHAQQRSTQDPPPTAPGPLDSERDLDIGDRAYTNSRVTEARAGDGYVVNARFIARRGARARAA